MFILKKEATFMHPITFYTPGDGGIQNENTFDAKFKILSNTRINEIRILAAKKETEISKGIFEGVDISDTKIAEEILVGWEGITDGDKDIPYTAATKKQVLEIPILGAILCEEYFNEMAKRKTKN